MLNLRIHKSSHSKRISVSLFVWVLFICFLLLVFNPFAEDQRVVLGNEIFVSRTLTELIDQNLGLVVNHTSVLPDGTHLVDALLKQNMNVTSLFSTEHGFLGNEEAGQTIENSQYKGIDIYSLHGITRKPSVQQMKDLDVLIYDIQDVGARFYTYITTMKYILEAASDKGIPVYILDRPNPVGGHMIEGPLLDMKLESFTAPCPIPIRYGLTCGELALMMKGEQWIPAHTDIRVIEMKGWKRSFIWEKTGLYWIPPSPNIPKPETSLAFPGTSLLGGIGVNHGIGSPNPFLQFGSPWLDPRIVIQNIDPGAVQGITLSSHAYIPRSIPGKTAYPPYKDRLCHGIRISIEDKKSFHSLEFTLALIKTLKSFYPDHIRIITERFDSLFGNEWLRLFIEGKLGYEQLLRLVRRDEKTFRKLRKKYLIY
ncbi:MAG: DUF1343 domain-containing protein [Candidatus Aminicenantes bacterium]|nr:DUF1343 domain-containing protein [Candidatus Aminicenantes bacterium]